MIIPKRLYQCGRALEEEAAAHSISLQKEL
jgi:hypothetical protein